MTFVRGKFRVRYYKAHNRKILPRPLLTPELILSNVFLNAEKDATKINSIQHIIIGLAPKNLAYPKIPYAELSAYERHLDPLCHKSAFNIFFLMAILEIFIKLRLIYGFCGEQKMLAQIFSVIPQLPILPEIVRFTALKLT